MIKVENISKRYGDHYAVKNLSFEIEKGKVYGFLGPNGAGKSTTMNIMTGYIAASEGSVTINGFDILKNASKAKKCIGYLPEIPPLYQDMTVAEYLMFVAELKGIAKKERKQAVDDVMEKTFIADMSKRLIKNLSKGYKQRVGLSQAMLGNPEIIILDEPTVGLDPKQINEIRDLIRGLKEEHAVILSSHILSEVAEVCDQLIIIAKGHMIASGTTEELLGDLGEANTIDITASADMEQIKAAVEGVESIKDISFRDSDVEGCIDCNIVVEGDADIRIEVSKALATNGIGIINMTANQRNIEEIFLQLTDDAYVDAYISEQESNAASDDAQNDKEASDNAQNAEETSANKSSDVNLENSIVDDATEENDQKEEE